jgi:hypothetical protein
MDEKTGLGSDRLDEVLAELANCACGVVGHAALFARQHEPALAAIIEPETERYRRLIAELREIHRGGRPPQ